MKLLRSEALEIIAFNELISLSNEQRESVLLDIYSEDDKFLELEDYLSANLNRGIIDYLKQEYLGVTSSYLESALSSIFNDEISVIGKEEMLFKCPCCGYRTLELDRQYLICKVCYWEDDGIRIADQYSSANHMTLQEAKVNYMSVGAVSDRFVDMVDAKGALKYVK